MDFFAILFNVKINWNSNFNSIANGASKIYKRTGKKTLVRDPLQLEHIVKFIYEYNPTSPVQIFEKMLIVSIIVLGFRTLFRGSDICAIKWPDVQFNCNNKGWIKVTNRWHKTDQQGNNDKSPFIELSGQGICPVQILTDYRDKVKSWKVPNSSFFSYL